MIFGSAAKIRKRLLLTFSNRGFLRSREGSFRQTPIFATEPSQYGPEPGCAKVEAPPDLLEIAAAREVPRDVAILPLCLPHHTGAAS
jgi:hypothetical protein